MTGTGATIKRLIIRLPNYETNEVLEIAGFDGITDDSDLPRHGNAAITLGQNLLRQLANAPQMSCCCPKAGVASNATAAVTIYLNIVTLLCLKLCRIQLRGQSVELSDKRLSGNG